MKDFFSRTRELLSSRMSRVMSDEQVKAFLHHTEVAYKKEHHLKFIGRSPEQRFLYERYSFEFINNISRRDLAQYEEEYIIYKKQQEVISSVKKR